MSAHLIAGMSVRLDPRVIYETFVSDQSQRTNDPVLINAAAEIHRHLHVTPLNIRGPETAPSEVKLWRGEVLPKKETFRRSRSKTFTCEVENNKEELFGSLKTGVKGVHKNATRKRITEAE